MKEKFISLALLLCMILCLGSFALSEGTSDELFVESDNTESYISEIESDLSLEDIAPSPLEVPESTEQYYETPVQEMTAVDEAVGSLTLQISYTGPELHKVYDKTNNIQDKNGNWLLVDSAGNARKLKISDFKLDLADGYSDVKIKSASVSVKLDGVNAGIHNWKVTFKLEGSDLNQYVVENGTVNINVPVEIQKRPVVVTPKAGLTKIYGTPDPTTLGLNCTVPGLLALTAEEMAAGKSLFTGKMDREKGESVGTYKYTLGTLDFGNSNYIVSIKDEVFTILPKSIDASDIVLSDIPVQPYTGRAIKPSIKLTYNGKKLKSGTDYKVKYKHNKLFGSATMIITGKGCFTGSRVETFKIGPKGTTISKVSGSKKAITVSWKKGCDITGYQVAYSLTKDFKLWGDEIIKGIKNTKVTIKDLKPKKTYYVRIRTYKRINGEEYYSPWSKAKKVRTK